MRQIRSLERSRASIPSGFAPGDAPCGTPILPSGGWARRLDRRGHAGASGARRDPPRSPCALSEGFSLREARRLADKPAAQNRPRRRGVPGRNHRLGSVDRALRPCGREKAERPIRPPLRHSGQYHPSGDSAERPCRPCQGGGDRGRHRPPAADLVERGGNLRPADRAGERAQYRPASQSRHRARGDQPLSFDQHRLRSQAGGTLHLRFPGLDLLHRERGRSGRLCHAVSHRRRDARQPVRLSRHG